MREAVIAKAESRSLLGTLERLLDFLLEVGAA